MPKITKYIRITADTNDGDNVERLQVITDEELALIQPLINAIKKFEPYKSKVKGGEMDWPHHHNFSSGDCLRDDLGEKSPQKLYVDSGLVSQECFDIFCEEFQPTYSMHSIVSIDVFEVVNRTSLFTKP